MLVNSNYTVGQYFLAYSIINSVNKKRNYKLILSGISPLKNGIKLDITDSQLINNIL